MSNHQLKSKEETIMGEVLIDPRATSAARIERRITELRLEPFRASSPKNAAVCRRHIIALEKLLRHPRPDHTLDKRRIIGGGGKRALLDQVEWSDLTKKRAPKKAPETSSKKRRGNKSPRSSV